MAVRPPDDDSSGPETIEFGIAALDARIDEASVEFPATADELVSGLDDPDIPYDASGNTVALRTVLDRIPTQTYESESQLLDQSHPIFEEYRRSTSNGFLSQLRALLPF